MAFLSTPSPAGADPALPTARRVSPPAPAAPATSREGYFWLRQASPPLRHLLLRDKAIQYLQEHIWQRGSAINLPHFNTPCSRLVIAASSQPGSEELLEAGVSLPWLLLPAELGTRSPAPATLLVLEFRVRCPLEDRTSGHP